MLGLTTVFNQAGEGGPVAHGHSGGFGVFEWAQEVSCASPTLPCKQDSSEAAKKRKEKQNEQIAITASDTIAVALNKIVTLQQNLAVLKHVEPTLRDQIAVVVKAGITFEDATDEILDIIRIIEAVEAIK